MGHVLLKKSYLVDTKENRYVHGHEVQRGGVFNKLLKYSIMTTPTYLLIPRCRVLVEKLNGFQLVKKFPAFHGTLRFITALTSVRHLFLS